MRVTRCAFVDGRWDAPLPAEDDDERTLVLAFGAPEAGAEPTWVDDLRRSFPSARIAGCSTAGEIHGERVRDESVTVTVTRFEHTEVRTRTVEIPSVGDAVAVGAALGSALSAPDLRAVLVLSDGTRINGDALAHSLQRSVGPDVAVSGGLAGDADRFGSTWVLTDRGCESGAVVGIGLYGDRLVATHGTRGGWFPFGPHRRVTASNDNVLSSLDDRPALDLYRDYLGRFAGELPAAGLLFPLRVWPEDGSAPPVVRTVLGVDDAERTMTFAGSIPTGWRAQLMMANPDDLVDAAADAAEELGSGDDADRLVLAVSCVGRRLLLGAAVADELLAVGDVLPARSVLTGFYSYGEVSPVEGSARLHNQTMTLTMLTESVGATAEVVS